MNKYPFPQGQLFDSQHIKDETVKLACTSFFAENLGDVSVTLLGRTLEAGDSFTVPFTGVHYKQDLRIRFTGTGNRSLYILQTTSQECEE
jgi:hypothetical protein